MTATQRTIGRARRRLVGQTILRSLGWTLLFASLLAAAAVVATQSFGVRLEWWAYAALAGVAGGNPVTDRVDPIGRDPLHKGAVAGFLTIAGSQPGGVPRPRRDWAPPNPLADNRMEVRDVEGGFVQSGVASISAGLDGGERLVLTDLVPAVGGMLLDPEVDEEAGAGLTADATGRARTR